MKNSRGHTTERGRTRAVTVIVVLAVLIFGLFIWLRLRQSRAPVAEPGSGVATATPGGLPEIPDKPRPRSVDFQGCPPEGDGGDAQLNVLKNRVDEAAWIPVRFDAILNLTWPPGVERRNRKNWSAADRATVARYEGIPVSVEGYLASAKQEGPESPNCHGADAEWRDYHIWLTAAAGEDRSRSIVVETTPRVRANHPNWRLALLQQIARNRQRVRISGWLMLDPEHPDQVGKTRGTIWEIHPIMQIEVEQRGRWIPLDKLTDLS
ncbi:MAG TPA: hypothetical protein VNQ79_01245 [Blastocatellia bacterium]|nr:hypothetical protein [Blastocatellia bacterium]